ncbi:hypothetical protein AcW1_006164 [Taiwanofungus camphoratus]|nr:hypothetical protein AcW1_006164 [Antrodia cinnamomea]
MPGSREHSALRPAAGSRSASRRRPVSRSRHSRNTSASSVLFLPAGPEALINPDGPIDDEVVELLNEFVHPHRHDLDQTLVEEEPEVDVEAVGAPADEDEQGGPTLESRQTLPWWKRPSPLWFLSLIPFTSIVTSATMAPRIEIYTQLVCEAYKPEYTIGRGADRDDEPPLFSIMKKLPSLVPLDDNGWELCSSDPVIQAAVAKLSLVMATCTGILGCLTTAWWGSMSDRYGRTRVMGFSALGLLWADCSFILVCKFSKVLPGGYWFLVCGPLIDGLLGGMSAVTAAIHAYMADCTDTSSRSRVFSLFLGLLFTGMSIGPTLGSLLISYTGHALSVFYIAAFVHLLYSLGIWFIIPESLSAAQMADSAKLHEERLEQLRHSRSKGGVLVWLSRIFGFLTPLALLFPAAAEGGSPMKKKRRDGSLLLLATGYGFAISLMGAITYKIQYMSLTFGWTSEQVGYWTSILGAARAAHLTLILPVVIRIFHPKPPAIHLPVEPNEPLNPAEGSSSSPSTSPPSNHTHSPAFDLVLARVSVVVEAFAYFLMPTAPNGYVFTAYSVLSAFGSGSSPAINSVASALYTKNGGKELGKLFGAMAVVQTICSQILGPFLFGMTYMRTVATFPKAIFYVAAGVLLTSFILFSFIRLRTEPVDPSHVDMEDQQPGEAPFLAREDTLVEVQEPLIIVSDEEDRGRKALKPSASSVDEVIHSMNRVSTA